MARQVKIEEINKYKSKIVRERYNAIRGHAIKGRAQEVIRMMTNGEDRDERFERAVFKSRQIFEETVVLGGIVQKEHLVILKMFQAIHASIKSSEKRVKV